MMKDAVDWLRKLFHDFPGQVDFQGTGTHFPPPLTARIRPYRLRLPDAEVQGLAEYLTAQGAILEAASLSKEYRRFRESIWPARHTVFARPSDEERKRDCEDAARVIVGILDAAEERLAELRGPKTEGTAAGGAKRQRTAPGKAEAAIHAALLYWHKWDNGGPEGSVGEWAPATIDELVEHSRMSGGSVSENMHLLFGKEKGDGMERYRIACHNQSTLMTVLRKIDGSGPDRFSGGGDALNHLDENRMAGAVRGQTGQKIAARREDPHECAAPD